MTRKTQAQLLADTAWTPALCAGATLTALHILDHGIIGGILSVSQVAAVFLVALIFGLFRKKHRQGVAIWIGRFVGYGLAGMVLQTIVGGLAGIGGALVIQGIGGIDAPRAVILLSLEALGFASIVLPGIVLFFARARDERGAGQSVGTVSG